MKKFFYETQSLHLLSFKGCKSDIPCKCCGGGSVLPNTVMRHGFIIEANNSEHALQILEIMKPVYGPLNGHKIDPIGIHHISDI